HNQAIWLVAKETPYASDQDGHTPFLFTPMFRYYELAANLQGLHAIKARETQPWFYADSRSFYRSSLDSNFNEADRHLRSQTVVSASVDSIEMLLVAAGEPTPRFERDQRLFKLFGGNFFKRVSSLKEMQSRDHEG